MRSNPNRARQRGVTLIVGMIMLILITLMVTTAFTLSSNNLKSVGNMQFRNESLAAANKALEQTVATQFLTGFLSIPPAQTITFDVNNDGTSDYTINVSQPTCVEATTLALGSNASACSGSRAGALGGCPKANVSTLWDMQASVTDSISGASMVVKQGVRIEVSSVQRDAVCPAT